MSEANEYTRSLRSKFRSIFMKKIPALLFACIMLSALCMEIQVSAQGCGTQEIPINGDWNIISNITLEGKTITLSGNLTIAPNGTLILVNTILKLNCASDGEYGIEVKSGGVFHAYNSCIETTTEDWNKGRFWFYVSENTNFTLEDSYIRKCGVPCMGTDYDGLTVKTENASVKNCTFIENNKGIVFSNTKNAVVSDCIFQSNKHWGVHIYNCSNINIENCSVLSTAGTGIRVEYSNEISIKYTDVISGGEMGISVLYSDENKIFNSVVSGNNGAGILFRGSNHNLVKKCTVSEHCGYYGIYAENSNTNEFCNNDFNGNTYNAFDTGVNDWHENYWSDYNGLDSNADGIGDVPYNISGGNNKDYSPLMSSVFVWEIANEICIANETKILDKNLVVKSAGKLTLRNATLIVNCTYNGEYQIEVYGKMSILNGSNITSANPDWHYLLSVRKNATFKMQNSSLSYSGWDNYNGGLIIEANNSCIENSVFSNNYCGIVFNSSGNALVSNCTFSNNLYCISGYLSRNDSFKNCSLLQNYVGISLYQSESCTIENCNVYNNSWYGIWLECSSNNNITNCAVYNNDNYGIYLRYSSNSNITNCNVYNNDNYGIYLRYSSNSNITNCNVYYNSYQGVMLSSSSNNLISNCTAYKNIWGIHLLGFSSNNQITNCAVYNNSEAGIWLECSSNNIVTNCVVYNNSCGLNLSSSSNNNQITNCNVTGNYYGLNFTKSRNITIRYTEISARLYGMYFSECSRIILSDSSISGSNESIYSYKSNFEIENVTGKDILVERTCANITSASFTGITYRGEYNSINVSWHLKIRAVIDGAPAKSASIIIYDAQDKKILEAETDENGEIECNIIEYIARGAAQKINYTPHKIVVVKNEFTKTCSVIMCRNTEVVMELEEIREEVKFISPEMLGLFAVVFGVIIMTLVLEYMSRRRYRRKRKL